MTVERCKVCRVLADRDMWDYESQLIAQWKGESGPRKGYRRLAEWLNVTMLRREMDRAGLTTLGNEAESKYERLQADNAIAEEVRTTLSRSGVPIETIEADFVSYGVVRTHLTDCLGETFETEPGDWEHDAVDIARSYAESKIEEAVDSAVGKGTIEAAGSITVSVTVELECERTHMRVPVDRAFRRGYVSDPDESTSPRSTDGGSVERRSIASKTRSRPGEVDGGADS